MINDNPNLPHFNTREQEDNGSREDKKNRGWRTKRVNNEGNYLTLT
jgi:hypothetical protein